MNGATALDCANTISDPKAMKMMTMGTSQNFFSWRRNWKNSDMTRLVFMTTSEHAFEMRAIAIPGRIHGPAPERVAPTRQRIVADEAPDRRQRNQHQSKQHRQDD